MKVDYVKAILALAIIFVVLVIGNGIYTRGVEDGRLEQVMECDSRWVYFTELYRKEHNVVRGCSTNFCIEYDKDKFEKVR